MKILFVCHRFPYPPDRGGKIRPFNMIRHLAAQGHRVTVASVSRSAEETTAAHGIAGTCHEYLIGDVRSPWQTVRTLGCLLTPSPSSMGYFYCGKLKQQIHALLGKEQFDLIIVHCSSVAHYVEHVHDIPRLLDFGDMDSQKWLVYGRHRRWPVKWGYRYEGWKLEKEEKRLAREFDVCTVTSLPELETLNGYGTGTESAWIPNGVDAEYFAPDETGFDRDQLSFVGRMDYFPNAECVMQFCQDVLPRLQDARPRLRFVIVGADPPRSIRQLANLPGVEVTGSVPDVRPFTQRSHLIVAPLNIARGTQNKILEAMAMGVPVVCSPIAARGVDAIPAEHLLTAADADEYVRQILRVLDDDAERERLARAGRARVLSHHSWEGSMQKLDQLIDRCVVNDARRQSN